jgi:hypothetical protein
MSALPVRFEDVRFKAWRTTVAEMIETRYGFRLAELPGLPLAEGFAAHDTPAEFVASCEAELLAAGGNAPSWPPPG